MPTDGLVPGEIDPLEDAPQHPEIGYISPPAEPYRYISPVKRLTYFERLKLVNQYGGNVHDMSVVSVHSTTQGGKNPQLVHASTQTPIGSSRTMGTQAGVVVVSSKSVAEMAGQGHSDQSTKQEPSERVVPRSRHTSSPSPRPGIQPQPVARLNKQPLHSNELSPSLAREGSNTQRVEYDRPSDGLTPQQREALIHSTAKAIRGAFEIKRPAPSPIQPTSQNVGSQRVLVRSKSIDDRKTGATSAVVATSPVMPSAAARSLLRRAYTRKLDQKTQIISQPSRQLTEFQTLEDGIHGEGSGNGIPARSAVGASPSSKLARGEVSAKGIPRMRGSSATRSAPLLKGAAPRVAGPSSASATTAFRKANPTVNPPAKPAQHVDPAVNVDATTKRTHQLHNNIVARQTALLNREKARAWQQKSDDRV